MTTTEWAGIAGGIFGMAAFLVALYVVIMNWPRR